MTDKLKCDDGMYSHWCPGCESRHYIPTNGDDRPNWTFNGNMEKPTFNPSVLLRTGHYCSGEEGKECWCTYEARFGKPARFKCVTCHYFLHDGILKFCPDSTHALAGQEVPLPLIPPWRVVP